MRINSLSPSFSGKLYLKNSEMWTEGMKKAIRENATIQKKLLDSDIIGNISTKIERSIPPYPCNHSMGEKIYKVSFTTKKTPETFLEYIAQIFKGSSGEKYPVNRHFHSEGTTIKRISKLVMK